jgi:hypothetical protein
MTVLKLPRPPDAWSQAWQTRLNQTHEIADATNRKRFTDIELELGPPGKPNSKLILRSPNGQRWEIVVSNAGVISAVVVP